MAAINKRLQFMIRWSPLFFAAATTWAIFAWRHKPASFGYFVACVGVGLICGGLIVVELWRDHSPLLFVSWYLVFFAAPIFIAVALYSDFEGKMNYQYMSVVVASIFGLMVVFRSRLLKLAEANT